MQCSIQYSKPAFLVAFVKYFREVTGLDIVFFANFVYTEQTRHIEQAYRLGESSMAQSVADFFNQVVMEYDQLIHAAIPRYDELLWAMFYYLPSSFQPERILELGCGTGNLTRLIAQRWPNAQITVVDISAEMLHETRQRLSEAHLTPIESAFEDLAFAEQSFDLVMASFSIHHLLDDNKKALFTRLAQWLSPGGFFVMADMLVPEEKEKYLANIQELERVARQHGASETHLAEWRHHRETLDHYANRNALEDWLQAAGLNPPALVYAYLFNTVLHTQKPH
jgi:tRNA (cmo5U34)-methyltransferase